eukprot:4006022-Pyramimonas_sp.AAC.1
MQLYYNVIHTPTHLTLSYPSVGEVPSLSFSEPVFICFRIAFIQGEITGPLMNKKERHIVSVKKSSFQRVNSKNADTTVCTESEKIDPPSR